MALDQLEPFGYCLLPGVFAAAEATALAQRLAAALGAEEPAVLRSRGQTYGSRDLIRLLPEVCGLPHRPALKGFLAATLGQEAGLVRALFFDKPPDRSWSLPWHKDRTVAVRNNTLPTAYFRRPTTKAGIPHVEAPESLLEEMLTLRLHLDPMTAENGPLLVLPGSHVTARESTAPPVEIHAAAGDVLAMRPLLSHSSAHSLPGTALHRRIIHMEFAPREELPDGYEWQWFERVL